MSNELFEQWIHVQSQRSVRPGGLVLSTWSLVNIYEE